MEDSYLFNNFFFKLIIIKSVVFDLSKLITAFFKQQGKFEFSLEMSVELMQLS